MSNEGTKEQIRDFIENAIENAKNPNSYEKMRKNHQIKSEKVKKSYGF